VKLIHHATALLVVLIWGTNFVFIRYGLDELEPFTFALLRFTLVALPLVFILPKPAIAWSRIIAYGWFIGVGQFGLLFWAMQANISAGLASLIIQMQVFFTIILSAVLMRESVKRQQIAALLICFIGLTIIAVYTDGQTTLLGITVILVAALSWSAGNIIAKQAGKIDYLAFIAWSSLFAIPPLALMAAYFEGVEVIVQSVTSTSWRVWLIVLWQSVGNMLIGYGLWNMLLSRYPASVVTPWALMVPVFGMSASALMLSEPMPWWKLLAISLILLGLVLNANLITAHRALPPKP
jgi:O-acetylserine/cysteine efflux transporter